MNKDPQAAADLSQAVIRFHSADAVIRSTPTVNAAEDYIRTRRDLQDAIKRMETGNA